MEENSNPNTCQRADDLVSFLYGEVSESEARSFERHLCECLTCKTEFMAFGQIRESMVDWRNESLGLAGAPIVAANPHLSATATQGRVPVKSALAALSEFFALSPLWLRGATAFAGLLFCVCAVLAVGYLKGRTGTPDLTVGSGPVYTAQELDKAVALAVEKARQEVAEKNRRAAEEPKVDFPAPGKSADRPRAVVAANLRRPFTPQERQELAADLRLITSKDDDDLDLNIDSNHPTP